MNLNATDIATIVGSSTNFLNLMIGSGIVGTALTLLIRHFDNEAKKKATLYYPLYLACNGLVDVIKNHEILDSNQGRRILVSSAKTLDEIVFNYGTIIYLNANELNEFLSMKKLIDRNSRIINEYSWQLLEESFEKKDFQDIVKYAESLISLCKDNIKHLRLLSE